MGVYVCVLSLQYKEELLKSSLDCETNLTKNDLDG